MKTFRFSRSDWVFTLGDFLIPFWGQVRSVARNWHLDDPEEHCTNSFLLLAVVSVWVMVFAAVAQFAGLIPIL